MSCSKLRCSNKSLLKCHLNYCLFFQRHQTNAKFEYCSVKSIPVMALSRGRGGVVDAKVDPDQGVYVEIERIMEVRTSSENCDFEDFPEDMFDFQKRVREIPDDFCLKDKYTTEQR